MEATKEDNADIQARKNARLYGFEVVPADAPELRCLPDVFWEVFDQCKRADAEVRDREIDLSEHDIQQHQVSQDVEDFTKRGVWNVSARSRPDADEGASSTSPGDAAVLGEQMAALSGFSVGRKMLLTALNDAKARKADVEATLNNIAAEALVKERLLCVERFGPTKK